MEFYESEIRQIYMDANLEEKTEKTLNTLNSKYRSKPREFYLKICKKYDIKPKKAPRPSSTPKVVRNPTSRKKPVGKKSQKQQPVTKKVTRKGTRASSRKKGSRASTNSRKKSPSTTKGKSRTTVSKSKPTKSKAQSRTSVTKSPQTSSRRSSARTSSFSRSSRASPRGSKRDSRFSEGIHIRVVGTKHDGIVGEIVGNFIKSKKRWPVKLVGMKKNINIKEDNLEIFIEEEKETSGGSFIPNSEEFSIEDDVSKGTLTFTQAYEEDDMEGWVEYVDDSRGTYQLKDDKIRVVHNKTVCAEIVIEWVSDKEFRLVEGVGKAKVEADRIIWNDQTKWKIKQKQPMSEWDNDRVCEWVDSLSPFRIYVEDFEIEGITGQRLMDLDEKALAQMGMDISIHRKLFLSAVEKMRDDPSGFSFRKMTILE